MAGPSFPLMGFSRHRMGTDGQGVTTLAAAWGCPLRCRLCLNPQCLDARTRYRTVSPEELYAMTRVDDLYFQATGGGVTFGGGEPLEHAEFISAFRSLCGGRWQLTAETSLNVPEDRVRTAMACVDRFIVDIKDMDPDVYLRYTGRDSGRALGNLRALLAEAGPDRVTVRVPHIPGFNTPDGVRRSADALRDMGVTRLDVFTYRIP